MKKELTRAILITLGATLFLPFLFGVTRLKDYVEAVAISSFGVSLLILLLGLVLVCIKTTRKYGQAFLLCCAGLMLASFTLCSSGAVGLF